MADPTPSARERLREALVRLDALDHYNTTPDQARPCEQAVIREARAVLAEASGARPLDQEPLPDVGAAAAEYLAARIAQLEHRTLHDGDTDDAIFERVGRAYGALKHAVTFLDRSFK